MAGRLVWAGYAAAGCALLRLPLHLYYGLGGRVGMSSVTPSVTDLPTWLSPAAAEVVWRTSHLLLAALLVSVAALALALVQPWGRRWSAPVLIVPAFVIVVAALWYALGGLLHEAEHLARVGPEVVRTVVSGDRDLTGARDAVGWLGGWFGLDPGGLDPGGVVRGGPAGGALLDGGLARLTYPIAGLTAPGPWTLALGLLLALAGAQRAGGPTARRLWLVAVACVVIGVLSR